VVRSYIVAVAYVASREYDVDLNMMISFIPTVLM
jgi:hypothetical protein